MASPTMHHGLPGSLVPVPDEEVSSTRGGCLNSGPEAGAETTGGGWRVQDQDACCQEDSNKEASPFFYSGTFCAYLNTGPVLSRGSFDSISLTMGRWEELVDRDHTKSLVLI